MATSTRQPFHANLQPMRQYYSPTSSSLPVLRPIRPATSQQMYISSVPVAPIRRFVVDKCHRHYYLYVTLLDIRWAIKVWRQLYYRQHRRLPLSQWTVIRTVINRIRWLCNRHRRRLSSIDNVSCKRSPFVHLVQLLVRHRLLQLRHHETWIFICCSDPICKRVIVYFDLYSKMVDVRRVIWFKL